MKHLILIRHAKAEYGYFNDDFNRDLTDKGIEESNIIANQILIKKLNPDLIISSGAKRALHTCKIISKIIKYSKNIKIDDNIYNTNYINLLETIKNIDNSINSLMIFGHNPSLFDLTKYFCKQSINIFPTCSTVSISFETKNWLYLEKEKLNFIIYPDLFK
tara:strand:+ start:592 stop:1074 length:483 start_codon:yes stop_codon:yes gene_type:complete